MDELKKWEIKIRRQIQFMKFLAVTMSIVIVVLLSRLAWVQFSKPKDFPEIALEKMPAGKHRIDVLLMDGPDLSAEEKQWMLRALIIVAETKMPTEYQHFKIIVRPSGFPEGYAGTGFAAAGYVFEKDLFLVDLAAVRAMFANASAPQRWTCVMAHEATHQWQARTGAMVGRASTAHNIAAYQRDPLEIQAYEVGVTVANVMPGNAFAWRFPDGTIYSPPQPNPYLQLAERSVEQAAEVFVRTQTTPQRYLQLVMDQMH